VLQPDIILDPASRSHLTWHWLLLDGSKISAIGSGDPPSGVEVLRFTGKTVMPGLVDSHGHLAFRHAHGPLRDQLNADRSAQLDLAAANMRSRLAQGITLMRDLSERDFLDIEVARARDAGRLAGPRVVCATRGIKAPDGHGYCGTPFRGEAAIRRAVQENRAAGAQFIKLYLTGSPYGTPEALGHAYLSLAEVRAATQEAHGLGMPVSAHAFAGAGIEFALAAGVDCIEHGMFPDDDQIVHMATEGTWLSTTYAYGIGEQAPAPVPEGLWDRAAERLRKMLAAGIALAAGTDEGSGGIAQEARALLSLGVPAWMVLDAITHAGARLCGLGDHVGALRPGYDADLVVLDGDPLEDLDSLTRVHAVIQAGVAVSQTLR
jgi:imidazolonepropionase-like amidohydrolase